MSLGEFIKTGIMFPDQMFVYLSINSSLAYNFRSIQGTVFHIWHAYLSDQTLADYIRADLVTLHIDPVTSDDPA